MLPRPPNPAPEKLEAGPRDATLSRPPSTPVDTSQLLPPPAMAAPTAPQQPHQVAGPRGPRSDPYYWLRDDSRSRPEVLAHLRAEQAYFDAALAPLRPLQQRLLAEIRSRVQEDDCGVPAYSDGYWYYRRFERGQQYPLHARRRGSMDAPEEILLDGNERARGHGYYHAAAVVVSEDGGTMAVAEDTVGRYLHTLRFKDLGRGAWLPDEIHGAAPDIVFANDHRTVFSVEKDPLTLRPFRVRRHRLGTPTAQDVVVFEERDPSFQVAIGRSKSDRYVWIELKSTLSSEMWLIPASNPMAEFQVYLPRERGHQYKLRDAGSHFVIRSNRDAPNFQLWLAPPTIPADPTEFQLLLAHRDAALLVDFEVFADRVAVAERSGGLQKIRVLPLQGGEGDLLVADQSAYALTLEHTPDLRSGRLRYRHTAMTTPASLYELDFATGLTRLIRQEPILGGFDPAHYRSEFHHATARDGAQVPVWLLYHRDTALDGSAPVYQSAYGSYGDSMDPEFRSSVISLVDRGFIYAIAAIRGGQELGRQWYEDGKLLNKKNTFHDFVDVSDYLVRKRYAAPDKIFAMGGSAGGLLMGAVLNEAPERYRGVIAHVPFVDVVTTMLDPGIPLTCGEFDEWGNPADPLYYDYMLSYSPYDQVRSQAYPAMMVTTALHDSQVQYFEAAKWVARLRERKTDHNLLLLKVDEHACHDGRSGRFDRLADIAEEFAFLLGLLGER